MAKKQESAKDKVLALLKKDKNVILGLDSKCAYFINSGHYGLNRVISGRWNGGWAAGTVNEIFGDPSAGKSIIILSAMVSMQNKNIFIPEDHAKTVTLDDTFTILDDTEKVYLIDFSKKLGLDIDDIIQLKRTKTVEKHFEQVEEKTDMIRKITKKAPLGVFLDSISQLSTVHEMKTDMKKKDMSKAGQVHKAMRKYSDFINKHNVMYLIASHVIANVGAMFGPKKVVKGGAGLAFQSSVRIDLHYKTRFVKNVIKTDESGERGEVYGVRIIADAKKNKVTAPFQFTVVDIYYDQGIDPYSGLFDYFFRKDKISILKKGGKGKSGEVDEDGTVTKKAVKGKPALYSFEGIDDNFERDLFPEFVIKHDLLEFGGESKYLTPIDKSRYDNSTEEKIADEETDSEDLSPIPAPPKPEERTSKTE